MTEKEKEKLIKLSEINHNNISETIRNLINKEYYAKCQGEQENE